MGRLSQAKIGENLTALVTLLPELSDEILVRACAAVCA